MERIEIFNSMMEVAALTVEGHGHKFTQSQIDRRAAKEAKKVILHYKDDHSELREILQEGYDQLESRAFFGTVMTGTDEASKKHNQSVYDKRSTWKKVWKRAVEAQHKGYTLSTGFIVTPKKTTPKKTLAQKVEALLLKGGVDQKAIVAVHNAIIESDKRKVEKRRANDAIAQQFINRFQEQKIAVRKEASKQALSGMTVTDKSDVLISAVAGMTAKQIEALTNKLAKLAKK